MIDRTKPYTEDERRVCDYLQSIIPEIGCGNDPIGFLIVSHEFLRSQIKWLEENINHQKDSLSDEDYGENTGC